MPEKMIREITKEYKKKGKSSKKAKDIAYAIATKMGWRHGMSDEDFKRKARRKAVGLK